MKAETELRRVSRNEEPQAADRRMPPERAQEGIMASIGVCIEPFFTGLTRPERVRKIAALGFTKYEFWSPCASLAGPGMIQASKDFDLLGELNARLGLETTGFLYSPGEEGNRAHPLKREDKNRFIDDFGAAAALAHKIRCGAFIITGGAAVPEQSRDASLLTLFDLLADLAREAVKQGITLLLEPLNTKIDHRDAFLAEPQLALDLVKAVNSPRLKLLYDIYHMQIMGGNILAFVRDSLDYIGHFHLAGVPGRNEPYTGELDYARIVREITAMGYPGVFGLEYWAKEDGEASLKKSLEYLS